MSPRHREIIRELKDLGVEHIEEKSNSKRLHFSYKSVKTFDPINSEEARMIREKLVELAGTTMPTYTYHPGNKTIELVISN